MIFTARPWKQAAVRGIWHTRGFRQCAIPRIVWWSTTKMPPESPWNMNTIVMMTEDFGIRAFSAKWYLHVVCDIYIFKFRNLLNGFIYNFANISTYKVTSYCYEIGEVGWHTNETDKYNLFAHTFKLGFRENLRFLTLKLHNLIWRSRRN